MAAPRKTRLPPWRSALRRLDFLPAAVALGGGLVLGALVWALLAGKGSAAQVPGWLVLLAGAWWLAAGAAPVAIETPVAPSPADPPLEKTGGNYASLRIMRPFSILYQAALGAALVVAGPALLARRGRHYLPTLAGRLGSGERADDSTAGPTLGRGGLWIHAASVGEVSVAATLVRALPPGLPLLVTTTTPTGQARARAAFAGRAAVAYLPFDLGFAVRRLFDRFAPRALVLVEGDYWPLVLAEAGRRGVPVAVVNGRVGDKSFARQRRLRRFLAPLLGGVRRFGVQSADDRDRLVALGVPAAAVAITGNLKYETPEPLPLPEIEGTLRTLAAGRPILLAGSTMRGEEEAVLDAFAAAGGGERALLLVAPRHPERWDEVTLLLKGRAVPYLRRSRLAAGEPVARPSVILLDSLGELAALYRIATAAFIGGTLVPTGGHNPLEAARFGLPIAVGPSMHNFRDMAAQFDRRSAWHRVGTPAELGALFKEWLDHPEFGREVGARAAALHEENRGAVARTLALLIPLLAEHGLAVPTSAEIADGLPAPAPALSSG